MPERKIPITEQAEWKDSEQPLAVPNVTAPGESSGSTQAVGAGVIISAISALIAGGQALGGLLSQLLQAIGSAERRIAIGLNNHTGRKLTKPKFYIFSGKIEAVSLEVEGNRCGAIGASKTAGPVPRGAVGVVTYEIEGTGHRLAVMYSVPFDYLWYSNWFKLGIIPQNVETDYDLYVDMYYDQHKLTDGNAALADNGYARWQVTTQDRTRYLLEGVMGTGGVATLNASIKIV